MKPRVTLVGSSELLRARTERSLARVGVRVDVACDDSEVASTIDDVPTWFVRAGAWTTRAPAIEASATRKPLVGFGAIRSDAAWNDLVAQSRGDLGTASRDDVRVASVVVEAPRMLRDALEHHAFDEAVWSIARSRESRAVRVHELDVAFDERLRVCVAITALRRGGAERIALDLSRGLRERGVAVRFVVASDRDPAGYDAPDDALFARDIASRHADLIPSLSRVAYEFGADVVHTHLFDADDVRALAALGPPVVVTVHNDRARWPNGFDAVTCDEAALVLGCSRRATNAFSRSRARAFGSRRIASTSRARFLATENARAARSRFRKARSPRSVSRNRGRRNVSSSLWKRSWSFE